MKNNYEPEMIDIKFNSKSVPCSEAACGVRHTIFITNTGIALGCGNND